jgi:hypothetical protein
MVFNATFNNISAISWWSVLFVEEIEVHYFKISKYLYYKFVKYPRRLLDFFSFWKRTK